MRNAPRRPKATSPSYSSIVVDANSGAVMQATNADSPRHPASLTKIMTLYLLFERLEAGQDQAATPSCRCRRMPRRRRRPSSASSRAKRSASRPRSGPSSRSRPMTSPSSWPRRSAATSRASPNMMTAKARALGMTQTTYRNASGLPDDEQITTARDQAMLGRAIQDRFPNYYHYFSTRTFDYRGKAIRNHNHLLGSRRRRRRHQDRLHPRFRLQHRHLGAPRQSPHRCGGVRRPHRRRARRARAQPDRKQHQHRRGQAHRSAGGRRLGDRASCARTRKDAKDGRAARDPRASASPRSRRRLPDAPRRDQPTRSSRSRSKP